VAEARSRDLIAALDEASLSRFHLRAVLVSGMGFFTDASLGTELLPDHRLTPGQANEAEKVAGEELRRIGYG
jgi:hypothetical protein